MLRRRRIPNPEWVEYHLKSTFVTSEEVDHFRSLSYSQRLYVVQTLGNHGINAFLMPFLAVTLASLAIVATISSPIFSSSYGVGFARFFLGFLGVVLIFTIITGLDMHRESVYKKRVQIYERYLDDSTLNRIGNNPTRRWSQFRAPKPTSSAVNKFLQDNNPRKNK